MASSQGLGGAEGSKLFTDNCSACHGQYGQGGPNPSRVGDSIVSISSSDFLKTRDDATIRNIIEQGQVDSGMPPFGSTFGGKLDDTQLDALVAFIRAWEIKSASGASISYAFTSPADSTRNSDRESRGINNAWRDSQFFLPDCADI